MDGAGGRLAAPCLCPFVTEKSAQRRGWVAASGTSNARKTATAPVLMAGAPVRAASIGRIGPLAAGSAATRGMVAPACVSERWRHARAEAVLSRQSVRIIIAELGTEDWWLSPPPTPSRLAGGSTLRR